MNNDILEKARRIRNGETQNSEEVSNRVQAAHDLLNSIKDQTVHNRNAHIADLIRQREQKESIARGQAMIDTQKARDAQAEARNAHTASNLDLAHGILPATSNAQAFANQNGRSSLDDAVDQIAGNNVLSQQGKVNRIGEEIQNRFGNQTAPEINNQYDLSRAIQTNIAQDRQTNAAINNSLNRYQERVNKQKAIAEAERTGDSRRIASLENLIQTQRRENEQKIWDLQLEMQIPGTAERIEGLQKQIDDIRNDSTLTELQNRLNEAKVAHYLPLQNNEDFKANSDYRDPGNIPVGTSVKDRQAINIARRINGYTAEDDGKAKSRAIEYTGDDPYLKTITTKDYLDHLDKDQKATFNYLMNTRGLDSAIQYISDIAPSLMEKEGESKRSEIAEYAKEHPFRASIESIPTNVAKAGSAVAGIADYAINRNINPNAWYNTPVTLVDTTRSAVGQDIAENVANHFVEQGMSEKWANRFGNAGNWLYGIGMSMADSAFNAWLGSAVSGANALSAYSSAEEIARATKAAETFTRTIMAMEATPSAVFEAKERGLSDEQAMTLGLVAGFAEYATEKWSVENLFSDAWEKNTVRAWVKQILSEGGEEGASNLINTYTDFIVSKDKSEWSQTIKENEKNGLSHKDAVVATFLKFAGEFGLDVLGGGLSGGGMGAGRVVGGAVNNAQYRVHNQMRTEGQKQGGVDYLGDMTRLAENAMNLATDSAEQIEALHTLNDEMERFYPKDTTKRTIDFLVEGAKIAQANGDTETATNYKLLEQTVRNNQQTFTNRLNQNRQAAQQTAQTETAEQTPTPSTAPSTELSTDSTTPSTESTTPSIQATIAQNQATTQTETAQTVSDAQQTVQNETNAVETGENAVEENAAQNASTNATENAERNEPGYRPSEQRVGAAAFGFSEDLDPEQAASTILRRVMQNAKDPMTLAKSGVRKAAIDGLNASVNNAIQSGQYTTEETEALKNYTNRVRDALRNSNDTLQKTLNATSAVLKRYGVKNIKIDETLTDARGYHKGDTIYVNPYLDTMQSVASVIAHETFHQARQGDANGNLLDDIDKYYTAIASRAQDREDADGQFSISNTGGRVNLYTDAQFVRTYADKIWEEFSPTEAGEAALIAYHEQHRDTTMEEAIAAVYEADPDKFWSEYWNPSESGETAHDYIREEKAANFIEQLAGTDGGALFRELVSDDRNLAQRIIDAIRNFLKLPAKERRFEGAEAYQRLADKFEKALADATGEEQQRAEMTAATAEDIPDSGKFSLSRPVERVGDLIAVHNLTEDKYLSSHKLGGFPAPSIAVVKAKTGHENYGPISVVFGSDTIDPQKDSRNRIFGGDAWTPMFPDVKYDYKVSGVENLDQAIYKLAQRSGGYGKNLASPGGIRSLFDGIMHWGDSPETALDTLGLLRDVQAAYLAAQGEKLKANDKFAAFAELDKRAPADKVKAWLRPAIEQIAGEGALDVAGERVPLTAENVVRAMYENRGSRGIDIYEADANGLRSMAAPEYQSIDEVRQNRDKLKRLDDKEYQRIVSRLDGYIDSIKDEIEEFNGGRSSLEYDKTILDALREGGTEEDIRYAFEEAGIGINNKLVRDVGVLYKLASQLPTDYFEAKPERVVGFDEVMYYIIPNDIAPSTAEMMENDGATVLGYTAGDEKERLKVLNSLKGARFSKEINTEQTETKAFKKWFGDSKAVDENGEPLVLYHGTDYYKPINIFKSGKHGYLGPGIYLTPNESFAQRYADKSGPGGTVYATWAKIENPLYVTSAEPAQEILKAITGSDRVYNNRMAKQAWSSQILTKADMNKLRAKGYDGIIWQYGKSPAEYMVFESNQIKSATDNAGTFDANNPDIRYSRELDDTYLNAVSSNNEAEAQRIVDEAAEAAMPNSKVRTRNGKLMKVYHGTTAQFNIFDPSKMGGKNGIQEGFGIYLTDNPDISAQYGARQIAAYANIQRPAYGYKKTIKRGELAKLIKASCEKEAQQFVDDGEYDSIKDAIKDTWISNYVDTYNVPSINSAYTQAANDILSMNDSDADIIGELLIGQGIRTYDRVIEFYNEMLTPITGIDGIWQKWGKNNIILAFDSSQVKSADAVSRNDNGDVIPVSERFNSETGDIRYSREITPEQDAEYMMAVESGDEETAQRMVDEAAAKNGYTTKIYHGTTGAFTVFDRDKGGQSNGMARLGFWFTPSEEGAKYWAENIAWWGDNNPHVIGAYVKLQNPKIYETATGEEQERNEARMLEISRILSDIDNYGKDVKAKYAQSRNYPALFTLSDAVNGKENRKYVDSGQLTEEEYKQIIQEANDIRENRKSVADLNEEYAELQASDAYEKLKIEYYKIAKRKASDANVGGIGMQILNGKEIADKMREILESQGYDGIIVKNTQYDSSAFGGTNDQYVVFEPEQIKDAASITYDNDGNVIPLSERFNPENEDIRYSRELDDSALGASEQIAAESNNRYSREVDENTLNFLNNQDTVKVYRAMQVIDGKLYPPMAAKVEGKYVEPTEIGTWYKSDERPDLIKNGKFVLNKGNGSTVPAAYNPYFHSSASPLNDQFSSAYKRPNLVVVEGEIPSSELTSGYKAEGAKNAVGETKWHAGPVASKLKGDKARRVFLSRWFKVNRIMTDAEVADIVADTLSGEDVSVPDNVVTPSLLEALRERGVRIEEKVGTDARFARDIETASNADLRRMLRESEEKVEYLKKQWTARTAFGAAQAVKPEDFNKQVRRLKDMMKYSIVTTDEIRQGLRELYDIMERPLKWRNDTAEARWNEAAAKAEELANEWASAAALERVINPDIADNIETFKDIYGKLRNYSGFYVAPEMTAEAGDKESFRKLRKQLSFMHLLGVDSNKAGVESGRMSVDAIYTDLARNYPGFFGEESELSSGELNGDYAKLQAIADVAGLAWEAAHDPYSVEQTLDEQTIKTELKDDLLHSFFDVAVPTKASSRPTENDAREAYAQGQAELGAVAESERAEGYQEGYNKAKFEDEGAVEAAHMREDLMEQRFAEDAERFQNTMRKMLNEREEKINRLEKRLVKRGWMDRARVERNGVMRNLNKLNRLLENPTRKQHIPQGLRASTAKLLESVGNTRLPNGKTVLTDRMQQIQADEMEKMRNFAHEIQIGLTGAASAENSNRIASTEGFLLQLADKINALEDYYNRAVGPDVDMSLRTDDVAVTQNYGFLHSLNQILTMAVHALDDANQFTIQGKNYTAENLGSLLVGDLNSRESEGYGRQKRKLGANLSDKLRNMTYETMSADLFFDMMGDNWKNIVAHSYREGQNRQAQHEHQFIEYMQNLLGDYDNMNAKRELIEINANGKPLNVTRSQLMQLYATYQRPAGRVHLENGGACFVDDRGNESRAYTVKITPEKFAELTSHLTEEDKRIADGLVKFMADECSEWGNDASMYMYGFRMYEDGSYIPLDVVNYAIPEEIADKIQKTKSIENASFTNPLKRNSTVPLRMTDIFDITNNHVRRMAAYNAYAPITNDMNRIMKLSDVSGTVQEKMGRRGYKYLQDFVQTVAANEVRNGEMAESAAPLTTAMNLYKRQAVAWNVSTMLKQPISIFRAANEIDGKYIRQALALGKNEYQRIKETMLNNSGVAYLKDNGYSDVGLGKTMEKLYTKNYTNDSGLLRGSLVESKAGRGLVNAYDWITEKGMAGAGRADESTWVRIWKACELEVAENHPGMTAGEKLRLVTQRFNDVIGKTQVVDTVLDTAPLMRNKAMQIFTPFMNEPTKTLGGLVAAVDAVRNNKSGAKKALGKAIGLYALSNLLIEPLITSLVSMWRDEKDDTDGFLWSLLEKMLGIKRDEDGDGKNDTTVSSVLTSNVASGFFSFPVINIAYDTISNAVQGFGSEKIDVAALSNLASASVALVNNMSKSPSERPKTMYRLWGDWIESAAAAMGLPVKTVRRQIAGTVRGVMDITNSDWAKWQYNKLYYNLDNATARSQKNFYDILASTYKRGDMETYEALRKELGDIVTSTPSLVSPSTIQKNIESRGGEIVPGTDLWNLDVQARFRLEAPVKGWKVENFLTGIYKNAEKEGIDKTVYDDVLLNMPDAYDYDGEDGEIEMTADQYDTFTRNVGSLSYKILSELSSSANADEWRGLNIDQKLHAIQKVYAWAKAKNKKDINPDYNINSQGKWMTALYDSSPNSASAAATAILDVAKDYKEQKKRANKK